MEFAITRSLDDGGDFEPDWRNRVVTEYLKTVATAQRKLPCDELLETEKDPVVRQLVRYHFDERCVCKKAIRYALATQQSNCTTGIASTIRAMGVAGCSCHEIAEYLKTAPLNIVIFTRLFWDVERYLDHGAWLESLVRRVQGEGPAQVRERRLLRIAFHKGLAGLRHELSPISGKTAEDVKALSQEVLHAVAFRALEYVQDLNDKGLAASQEDFHRYHLISMANSRGTGADAQTGSADNKWLNWFMEAAEGGVIPDNIIDNWNAKCDQIEGKGIHPGRRGITTLSSCAPRLKKMDPEKRPRLARDCYRDRVTGDIVPIEFKEIDVPEAGPGHPETGEKA